MIRRTVRSQTPSGRPGEGSRHAWGMAAVVAFAALTGGAGAALAESPSLVAPTKRPATQVTDDAGTTVVLTSVPQRVVSLSPANTEIVFALGAGDRLVGGTDFDDYPAQAAALPDVASYTGVHMEQLVALHPDLVLAGGNGLTPDADIEQMRGLGYPVVVVYAQSVDGVLADIQLIGEALGGSASSAADTVTADMRASIARISGLAASAGSDPRTFYEIGDDPELYGPAPDSFIADLVTLAGGDAITTGDPAVFSLPIERLVAADPQVIVLGDALYGTCPDAVAARPGWAGITAVKGGAIRAVNDTVVTRPGPRLADGLASLTRAIHPELAPQLTDFPADPPMCATGSPAPSSSLQP